MEPNNSEGKFQRFVAEMGIDARYVQEIPYSDIKNFI